MAWITSGWLKSCCVCLIEADVSCEYGSNKYYALCGFGGVLSCGLTHTAVVPLDLIKCRIQVRIWVRTSACPYRCLFQNAFCIMFFFQVNPGKYKSIFNGFSVTLKEDGVRGLGRGWSPTFIGYSMQGLCKFGFYELFKVLYNDMLGEVSLRLVWPLVYHDGVLWPACFCLDSQENAYVWRTSVYLAASASAEFFADIALAPMEACKVRIQTQPGYARTLRECAPKMHAEEGLWAWVGHELIVTLKCYSNNKEFNILE